MRMIWVGVMVSLSDNSGILLFGFKGNSFLTYLNSFSCPEYAHSDYYSWLEDTHFCKSKRKNT